MDVDYSRDDSNGLELEGNHDFVSKKFKDLSKEYLDDEIEKYISYATQRKTSMKLPDERAKFTTCLQNLVKEEARQSSGF